MIKVMAVDDEKEAELLFKYFFKEEIKQAKLELDFYTSAEECLNAVKKKNGNVDIILSDINMPHMNGFELLDNIQKDFPHIKFCMVSAYENADYRKKASELGAYEYVAKPIDFEELKAKVLGPDFI